MTELKVNLQGSWKRVLAMITVVAMCFTVVYVSPVSATDDNTVTVVTNGETSPAAVQKVVVTLDKTAVTAGETAQAAAEVTAIVSDANATAQEAIKKDLAGKITWAVVSGSEVAAIDNAGKITTNQDKAGVVKIVAVCATVTSDEVTLTVNAASSEPGPTPGPGGDTPPTKPVVSTVEAVKISDDTLKLTVGESKQLSAEATVSPTSAVAEAEKTWSSDATAIATVDKNGKVTAVAAGTANVTVVASIGTSKSDAICKVIVEKKEPEKKKPTAGTVKLKDGGKVDIAKNGTATYKAPKNKKVKKVTIPATVTSKNGVKVKVTSIKAKAFKGCNKLTNVTIGKNVKTIGASAFQGCKKLKSITLPKATTTINKNAFAKTPKLKKIVIKSTKMTKKTIKAKAFSGVTKSAKVKVPKSKVKSYKTLFQNKGLPKKCKVVK